MMTEETHASTEDTTPEETAATAGAEIADTAEIDPIGTATYSPEDNKIRIYPFARLDPATYARVRAAGFIWAPRQKIFVAPMWTPYRADLAAALCGEIGDEDQSLVERAEDRAERFEDYSDRRRQEAESARKAVSQIADGIPFGQPILIGHHSERRARKDAERIQNGMTRAVKMWETSKYWQDRAASAIAHAKYKELPAVRYRRIKTIEADKRRQERAKAEAAEVVRVFGLVDDASKWKPRPDGTHLTRQERACYLAGRLTHGPRNIAKGIDRPDLTYSAYDVLQPDGERYTNCPAMTVDEVAEKIARWRASVDAWADRWIAHFDLRLAYERAMLGESGGIITDRSEYPIVPGGRVLVRGEWLTVIRVNRKDGQIASVTTNDRYVRVKGIEQVKDYQPPTEEAQRTIKAATKIPPIVNEALPGTVSMTKAEFDERKKYGGAYYRVQARTEEYAAYRYPVSIRGGHLTPIFLTDKPIKARPLADETPTKPKIAPPERAETIAEMADRLHQANDRREAEQAEAAPFQALKEAARAGVLIVSAPQLFPTPEAVARRVVALADIQPGECVLEPSAGTGNLIRPIVESVDTEILAYEINRDLCSRLERMFPSYRVAVRCADFLTVTDFQGQYPKIVMNPPFKDGADIRHIQHARTFLASGGRLVAICAAGPRQRAAFEGVADQWIDLPPGSFLEAGTGVNAAIVVFERRD